MNATCLGTTDKAKESDFEHTISASWGHFDNLCNLKTNTKRFIHEISHSTSSEH